MFTVSAAALSKLKKLHLNSILHAIKVPPLTHCPEFRQVHAHITIDTYVIICATAHDLDKVHLQLYDYNFGYYKANFSVPCTQVNHLEQESVARINEAHCANIVENCWPVHFLPLPPPPLHLHIKKCARIYVMWNT